VIVIIRINYTHSHLQEAQVYLYLSARTLKNVPDTTARIPEHMVIMHTPIVLNRTKRLGLDPIP
jgi:hypothetical protein